MKGFWNSKNFQKEIRELIRPDSSKFTESIKDPTKSIGIPYPYRSFLMMDILNLKKEEIDKLSFEEYFKALDYCWLTYTLRRPDFILKNMFMNKKDKKTGKPVYWDTPIEEQYSIIPEYIKKGGKN